MPITHSEQAATLFLQGYNCAQAVALAFEDVLGLEREQIARMASPFGGGMGRLREVCGAVSGMWLVLGTLYGYDAPDANEAKKQLYKDIQELAAQVKEEAGSIVCRDILKKPSTEPTPAVRTAEYYATRPCERMVTLTARLMDDYIAAHPL